MGSFRVAGPMTRRMLKTRSAICQMRSWVANFPDGSRSRPLSVLYSLGYCSLAPWFGYHGRMVAGVSGSEVQYVATSTSGMRSHWPSAAMVRSRTSSMIRSGACPAWGARLVAPR